MYDNTIKLLKLETIKNQIQSLESISTADSLIVKLVLNQSSITCSLYNTKDMHFKRFLEYYNKSPYKSIINRFILNTLITADNFHFLRPFIGSLIKLG